MSEEGLNLQSDLEDINSLEHKRRWPKIHKLLEKFSTGEHAILPSSFANPESPECATLKMVYARALEIHKGQERQETIGEEKAEYILHIEEVFKDFLETLASLTLPPEYQEEFQRDALQILCTLLLHDSLEDIDVPRHTWNFDDAFAYVTTGLQVAPEYLEGLKGNLRFITKTVSIPDRAERNTDYYERLKSAPFFVRLLKLCDLQNNVDTLDETDITKSKVKKIIQFIEIMDTAIATGKLPVRLHENTKLFRVLKLAREYNVREVLYEMRARDVEFLTDLFDTFPMNESGPERDMFFAQKKIIQSLYIWSKDIGYMSHLDPRFTEEDVMEKSPIPDFFTEEEFSVIEGLQAKVESIKKRLDNPEKLVELEAIIGEVLNWGINPVCMPETAGQMVEVARTIDPFLPESEWLDAFEQATQPYVELSLPEKAQARDRYVKAFQGMLRKAIKKAIHEKQSDMLGLRRQAIQRYKETGWIYTRAIGPNMTLFLERMFFIGDPRSPRDVVTIPEEVDGI